MAKFTFICNDEMDRNLTMTFEEVTLTEVTARFEEFMRGCGFYFDGSVQIVEQDESHVETDHTEKP